MEYPPTSLLAVGGGLYLCSSPIHDYSLNDQVALRFDVEQKIQ